MTAYNKAINRPVIGLCGRSGSGKTTVCEFFAKYGIMPIDTDKVYRELTMPVCNGEPSQLVKIIAREYGDDVVRLDGSLDRPVLAAKVFGDKNAEQLLKLNAIAHKHILGRTREIINEYFSEGAKGVIVDAPALFESGFDKECDAVVCVVASDDERLNRIMARDGVTEDVARKRVSSQISDEELIRRADFVIYNRDADFSDNEESVDKRISGIVRVIFEKHCGDN